MRRTIVISLVGTSILLLLAMSACAAVEKGAGTADEPAATPVSANAAPPGVLLFGIGMHIEPLGSEVSSLAVDAGASGRPRASSNGDYNNTPFFQRHVADIENLAGIIVAHNGAMTVQAQSPFTSMAVSQGETVLQDLAAQGHEIALHFHEDAHLGRSAEELPAETWCSVMQEEISLIQQASGVSDLRYWSGGNLYPQLLEAASCAGLDVNSDWKNPQEQTTATELIGTDPWRPAGGSRGNDVSLFATHDPAGPVIFLPNGRFDRNDFAGARRSETAGGDEAYFEYLEESLLASLAEAKADPDGVHVFHFTVHPGEFRGAPDHPFEVIDRFLSEVVDPLVASGEVDWATFSQMADAYAIWEQSHPGQDPRGDDSL